MPRSEPCARIDPTDLRLMDYLHGGFPLSDRPFADVGIALRMEEDEVLARLERLLAQGVLTRFGPLFQIERAGGRFVLAALEVPEEHFDEVAALVNAMPEVAHNYKREHAFNMWFVIATDSVLAANVAITRIEMQTGLQVHAFPKEREFFVELHLPIELAGDDDGDSDVAE